MSRWFRKKYDQQELDSVRATIRDLEEFQLLSDPILEYDSSNLFALSQSSPIGLPSMGLNTYSLSPIFFQHSSQVAINRYSLLYDRLANEFHRLRKAVQSHHKLLPGMFPDIVASLEEQKQIVYGKVCQVFSILDALHQYTDKREEHYWDLYLDLEQRLDFNLSDYEKQVIDGNWKIVFLVANRIESAKKSFSRIAAKLASEIVVSVKRDIRQCYRNLVRLLFKNMDDNSGEAHASIALKMCVVPHLNYYSNYETEYQVIKRYRARAY